jgi:hypothetical protein
LKPVLGEGRLPKFSDHFGLGLSQYQLDFVDVNNEKDTPVYVDPYAIEIRDDEWSEKASGLIRSFFTEVLAALRRNDDMRAVGLMSHLTEPKETFLGVSSDKPRGRGVGREQAQRLINAIRNSTAFASGLLADLSEMALYVEGVDRDKVSDLTTNIIRGLLVDYTNKQCELYGIPVADYNGPSLWDGTRTNWVARAVKLPYIGADPILLVPKHIVRVQLSINGQEFYNKQITDFLVAENLKANSSLVQTIKGQRVVYKKDVREENPKSKSLIAEMVRQHPALLDLYKEVAAKQGALAHFSEDDPSVHTIASALAAELPKIPAGEKDANRYHVLIMGALTLLFYPQLIAPRKEWRINEGRKRVDIVYTNSADTGFFAHRRDADNTKAATVIVECKNYTEDLANPEYDQLLGRFDDNRGYFGVITCRQIADAKKALALCKDAAVRKRGFMIVLTDEDIIKMLTAKAELRDEEIAQLLHEKFRDLIA